MKTKTIIISLFICLICASIPVYKGYAHVAKPLVQQSEKQYQNIISSLLMPHISKSVSNYYSKFLNEEPLVDPWDIEYLSIERPNNSFEVVVKVQVLPYVGPHLDVGTDIITITVEGTGEVIINKFEHIKSSYLSLPENWQHIIKRT